MLMTQNKVDVHPRARFKSTKIKHSTEVQTGDNDCKHNNTMHKKSAHGQTQNAHRNQNEPKPKKKSATRTKHDKVYKNCAQLAIVHKLAACESM